MHSFLRPLAATAVFASLLSLVGCPPPEDPPDGGMDAGADAPLADAGDMDSSLDGSTPDGTTPDGATPDAGPLGTEVSTESGTLMGERDDDLVVFRGVPYAAPPVGEQRWRRPERFGPVEGLRDASAFGSVCPQLEGTTLIGDEDCLFLNVWAPRARGPHPVMVFIHGGSYVSGAGSIELYEASNLVRDGDVVVVTLNYRLGALGFLNAEALAEESGDESVGNYGIYDQIAALEWVQRNITAFGGDADQVTIFGESAGAISVCTLLGSELADGLYHRAILESGGGCVGFRGPRDPIAGYPSLIERGANLLTNLGCADDEAGLMCGRAASVADIIASAPEEPAGLSTNLMGGIVWGPGVDGVLLSEDPIDRVSAPGAPEIPVIIGTNLDEAIVFTGNIDVNIFTYRQRIAEYIGEENADAIVALYPVVDYVNAKAAFNAFATDLLASCTTEHFADRRIHPTYLYEFRHSLRGLLGLFGATHTLELFFLFGHYFIYEPDANELALGDSIRAAWSSFAHSGEPTLSPAWPVYDVDAPGIAVLEIPMSTTPTWRGGRCDSLRALGLTP